LLDASDPDLCLRDLHATDPRHDKTRIQDAKGGLLQDSYRWILDHDDFKQWRDGDSRLLWIKGDPGKGKTMLLCGIIDELTPSTKLTNAEAEVLLSYFFCQATDSRINNATAILRGLIYLLVKQQSELLEHVRKEYNHKGKALFEDANAWVALSKIFTNIMQDPSLKGMYLVVDALDECETDLQKILALIIQTSEMSRTKWIISSRNRYDIEQKLRTDRSRLRLSLELRQNAECVSRAVDTYIEHCLSKLQTLQGDDNEPLRTKVRVAMRQKASGTFLWVSLVAKELEEAQTWEVEQILDDTPSDLKGVYRRMLKQIRSLSRRNPDNCRLVLSTAVAAYRPLRLPELGILSGLPEDISRQLQHIADMVKLCGSFLTLQDEEVYFIHQTAKDFLLSEDAKPFLSCEISQVHHSIFSRSLDALSRTLRRDIYNLR
jgi:hypothetical protein